MLQAINNSNSSNTFKNIAFKSVGVNNTQPASTSLNNQEHSDRYSRYAKEFNEIPRKAHRFARKAQLIGIAVGALSGFFANTKGWILLSAKSSTLVGAAAGWLISAFIGACAVDDVVAKQNALTRDYMEQEEKYLK